MRVCNICGDEYPETNEYFYKNSRNKKGLEVNCKDCARERKRQYREYHATRKTTKPTKLDPHEKTVPGVKRLLNETRLPPGTLDINEVKDKIYKNGWYRVDYKNTHGNSPRLDFSGKLIQQTRDLIVLEDKNGVAESFQKVDFISGSKIEVLE